jgi:hypothetical protein
MPLFDAEENLPDVHIIAATMSGEEGCRTLERVLAAAPSAVFFQARHGMLPIHMLAYANKTPGRKLGMVRALLRYGPTSANLRAFGFTALDMAVENRTFEQAALNVLRLATQGETTS